VLFDAPVEVAAVRPEAEDPALVQLDNGACEPGSSLALYGALRRALDALCAASNANPHFVAADTDTDTDTDTVNDWTFAPLPLASYHVTAWDGINVANLAALPEPQRAVWGPSLAGLPGGAVQAAAPALRALTAHPGACWRGRLAVSVQGLSLWGEQVLVARLEPADAGSQAAYSAWAQERRALCAWAEAEWGLRSLPDPQLHVSLGYFMQPAGAQRFARHLQRWEQQLCDAARGLQVQFSATSVHAFSDMASFYPLAAALQSH
jgi:hypothetical protein